DELIHFGHQAETVVLKKRDAIEIAAKRNIFLVELGGTGGGIIGSLAGVALRGGGNGGRFVDLPGIRNITGMVTVAHIKQTTAISSIEDIHGNSLDNNDLINSLDWIRPTLLRGEPVLRVRPEKETSGKNVWLSTETRHDKDKQKVNN
ncbi:MAG: hypothetical protein NTV30_04965, partial [Chloroflexi bacterium]|nr:hypothetical protein [Chloroflexota bacterium]